MLSERVLCNLNPDIITLDYACAIGKGEKKKIRANLVVQYTQVVSCPNFFWA